MLGEVNLGFSQRIRNRVKEDQNNCCAFCGNFGCLEIHHIVPISQIDQVGWNVNQIKAQENAVGLCGEEGNDCHGFFDILARDHNMYFDDLMEEQGLEYALPRRDTSPKPITSIRPAREPARYYQTGDD